MQLRNKEYLNKVNAGNPDWDEETGSFKDEKKPAEASGESEKENSETDTDFDKKECRPETESASDEMSKKETQNEKGSKHRKKHKKQSKFKEKGDKYENVMEKGDVKAIILAAFRSFWPIFLVLIVIFVVALLLLKYAV